MKKAFVVFVVLLLTAAASFTACAQDAASWSCLVCGVDETNEACHDCEIEHGSWICPKCGTINTGDTCSECGIAKSDLTIEKYDNGNYYIGELKNGKRDGKGTHLWTNGNIYTGDWKEEKRTGNGQMTYANGNVYQGEWLKSQRSGIVRRAWWRFS